MFDNMAEKYSAKHVELTSKYNKVQATTCSNCLEAGNTTATIRETFKFIKEKEDSSTEPPTNIRITMGLWIQQDQSNQVNNNVFTFTLISGVITKVRKTYAELSYVNNKGEVIKTVVSYDGIIYFNHAVINEYLEEYVARISKFPPLCKNEKDENYEVLKRLGYILESTDGQAIIELILDGVLAGGIRDIAIVSNLIIVNQAFVIPVTSISGFLQTGNCNE